MITGQDSDDARQPTNNTNTNCDTGDSVYGAVIARVHPIHLINNEQC